MLRNTPLRYRLLVGVILSLALVFGTMALVSTLIVRGVLTRTVKREVQNLVGEEVSQIDGFFNGVGRIPVLLANASAVDKENNEMLLRARIREMLEHNPEVYGSTVAFEPYAFYPDRKYFSPYYSRTVDWQGLDYVQLGTDDYVYFRDWEWYTGPRDTGGLYWSLPYFDEGAGDIWMVTASYPVMRDGEFIAVATMDVPIENIKQNLGNVRVGESGYALMFDPSGGIIAASGIEDVSEESTLADLAARVARDELTALLETIQASEEGVQEIPDVFGGTGTLWAVYTLVPSTKWHVVTFVSAEEMLAPVTQVLWSIGGISLAGLAILAGVVSVLANTVTQPIDALRTEALAIAEGDLSRRVSEEGRDEISALGQAFNLMADELAALLASLEQRVAERTAKLRAAAEVSRTTTSLLDPQELLPEVVDLVRERFSLYYVGLFLVDAEDAYAVLRAGTGAAGRDMLARGHKLAVGGSSMIGQCVAQAEARIALDVGEEAVRFDNPFLPETRSEMALPLHSRGRVIGAMSVQSVNESAFDETDISVMQTMADQVATAIDNARLFAEGQEALEMSRRAYGELSRDAWLELLVGRTDWGYRYAKGAITPLKGGWPPEMVAAVERAQPVAGEDEQGAVLTVPVKIREQVVGVLNFRKDDAEQAWSSQEQALLETIAEQVALALESARLYQDTQRRALSERLIAEIAAHMRETLDLETVLQTAVKEISDALDVTALDVRLNLEEGNMDLSQSHETQKEMEA